MKHILNLALAISILAFTVSFAEIKLAENLTLSGFVDMSAKYKRWQTTSHTDTSTADFNLDQVELDFVQRFSSRLSARFDLNYVGGGTTNDQFLLEQGFITLSAREDLNIHVGRFLSVSGFEAAEPTGLFQYSRSKAYVYGLYQNGISASYKHDIFGVYGALVTDAYDLANTEVKYSGFEGQVSVTPIPGLVSKVTYVGQYHNRQAADTKDRKLQSLVNAWAMYSSGSLDALKQLDIAGEFSYMRNSAQSGVVDNGIAYLGLLNASWGKMDTTIRYSAIKWGKASKTDNEITFAQSFALYSNLDLIAEYKRELEKKVNNLGFEALYTF